MDFIFMLTHGDRTVANSMDVLEDVIAAGVSHIGFKDVGADAATLAALAGRIHAAGASSYLEVVSTTPDSIRASLQAAAEIGVQRVLGGQDTALAEATLPDGLAGYYPFPGVPAGHPTILHGGAAAVEEDCRRFRGAGCPGADLLAYRASEADPLDLIRAARRGLADGYLIVAGSIDSADRIRAIADAGADAFTIGTAVFEDAFDRSGQGIAHQCARILEACEAAG